MLSENSRWACWAADDTVPLLAAATCDSRVFCAVRSVEAAEIAQQPEEGVEMEGVESQAGAELPADEQTCKDMLRIHR